MGTVKPESKCLLRSQETPKTQRAREELWQACERRRNFCFLLSWGHTSLTWKWKKVGGDNCSEKFKGLASVPALYSHVYSRSIR